MINISLIALNNFLVFFFQKNLIKKICHIIFILKIQSIYIDSLFRSGVDA